MREFLTSTMLVAFSLVFAFVSLEIGFRLMDGVPILSTENFIARRIDLVRVNTGPVAYDPLLGWRLTNYFAPAINRVAITLGDDGIRMNGHEQRPVPTEATIAVGSSSTFGIGVPNRETWPAQLERILGEPVANAGSEDWGMDQIVLRTEAMKGRYRPRALIVAISDRDVQLNGMMVYRGAYKPYFVVNQGELLLRPPHSGPARDCIVHSKESETVIAYLLMRRLALLKQDGTKVVVVLLYERDTVRSGRRPASMTIIAAAAREHGMELVDTFDDLVSRLVGGANDRRIWAEPPGDPPACSHQPRPLVSPLGHRLVAELVASKAFGRPAAAVTSGGPVR